MMTALKNRSFLKLSDFSTAEIQALVDLADRLKAAKAAGTEVPTLTGKNIALIFEKDSTRTRCAFEVACFDQGAHVTYLGPSGNQIGHKESMEDTALVLGGMYHGIQYRGAQQSAVETLAQFAGVPVYNGITNEWHPTQMLADVMTMRECCDKPVTQISYAYVGDARNNVGHSLLELGCLLGMDVRIAAPRALWPKESVVAHCRALAAHSGARMLLTETPAEAVAGVDFVHTDVWVSMGEPESAWRERIELLQPYQVNAALMHASGNAAVKFMHCLPAFHDRHTQVGEWVYQTFGLDGIEVTDEVFKSPMGIQMQQAHNRLHTIKAVLVATLGDASACVLA